MSTMVHLRIAILAYIAIVSLYRVEGMCASTNTLVILDNKDQEATQRSMAILENRGFRVRHILSRRIILGYYDSPSENILHWDTNIKFVYNKFDRVNDTENMDSFEKRLISICNLVQDRLMETDALVKLPQETISLAGDVREPLRIWKQRNPGILSLTNASDATSSYMSGRVAISLFFMESAGNGENWSSEQEDIALAGIIIGLDRWAEFAFDNDSPLSWFYDIHLQVPTSYEPIEERSVPYYDWTLPHWEFLWMNDALAYLGYADGWDGIYDLIRNLRVSLLCDWAFVNFVVMDSLDEDHRFADGSPAYAGLGGPHAVLTYFNAGWGPQNIDRVAQHEVGHVFGAADEYSGGCSQSDCTTEYGFLHVVNGNCEVCNSDPDLCIMGPYLALSACYWTEGQIGWHDYDGDQWNEAPDRNTRWSQNIWNVNPGDMIDIFDNLGRHVRKIPVTPENHNVNQNNEGFYVWDCTNFAGERVTFQIYNIQVNGQNRPQITPDTDEFVPILSGLSCSGGILHFHLTDDDTAGDFVRIKILSQGQEVSRPLFDKLLFCGQQSIDLSSIFPGNYDVEIRAWDAGGNAASPLSGNITLTPQTPTGISVINNRNYEEQWQNVLIHWDPVPPGIGVAIERSVYPSGGWSEIGRVTGQDYFEDNTALGSEMYVYQIRAYYDSYYSGYAGSWPLRVLPQMWMNFLAYAGLSNRVRVSWDPPTQQKPGTLSEYWVRRKQGLYSAHYGPFLGSPVYVCSELNTPYVFGVRVKDIYNNYSIYTKQDVTTGSWDNCLITPDGSEYAKDGGEAPASPDKTGLFQNVPNPFNSSTLIRYGLKEGLEVTIHIYDLSGRVVSTIPRGFQEAGFYEFLWDGSSSDGKDIASGVYFCILVAGENQEAIKVLLLG